MDKILGGVIGSEIKMLLRFEVYAIEIVFNANWRGRVMERDEVLVFQKAWNSELHLRYKTGMYACTTCGATSIPKN